MGLGSPRDLGPGEGERCRFQVSVFWWLGFSVKRPCSRVSAFRMVQSLDLELEPRLRVASTLPWPTSKRFRGLGV